MRFIIALGFTLLAASASAQSATDSWQQPNVASAAQAQTFVYKTTITPFGGTPLAPITLTSVSCTGTPTVPLNAVSCTGSAGPAGVAALITGAKSTLNATDPTSGTTSAESAPFTSVAAVPASLKVQ